MTTGSSTIEPFQLPDWSELPPPVQGTWQTLAADLPLPPDTQFAGPDRQKLYELSPAEWAARIGRDPVLAGKVLAVANSAALGQATAVVSIARAAVLLGYNLLETILIAYHLEGVIGRWPKYPRAHFEHTRDCCAAASVCGFHLAKIAGLADSELLGTSALLARLGALVYGLAWPDPGLEYAQLPDEVSRMRYELERWQVTASHLSGLVARQWGLPVVLQSLLANHSRPLIESVAPDGTGREIISICCATVLGAGAVAGRPLNRVFAAPEYAQLLQNVNDAGLTFPLSVVLSSEKLARELQALRS
jgi:hypothetical protein